MRNQLHIGLVAVAFGLFAYFVVGPAEFRLLEGSQSPVGNWESVENGGPAGEELLVLSPDGTGWCHMWNGTGFTDEDLRWRATDGSPWIAMSKGDLYLYIKDRPVKVLREYSVDSKANSHRGHRALNAGYYVYFIAHDGGEPWPRPRHTLTYSEWQKLVGWKPGDWNTRSPKNLAAKEKSLFELW